MFPLLPLIIGTGISVIAAVVENSNSREDYQESRQNYYEVKRSCKRNLEQKRKRNRRAERLSRY